MTKPILVLASVVVFVGCGDPAEWRPARSVAKEHPAAKAAYRVHVTPDACDSIGVVHAKGGDAIADIAETAANHGGTHYVVRDDRRDYSLETRATAVQWTANVATATARTRVVEDRATWAEVYRCP